MKQIFFCLFTSLLFYSSPSLSQTKICSPLLMMLPGGIPSENRKFDHPDDLLNSDQDREKRGRELTEGHPNQEQQRGSVVLAREDPSSVSSMELQNSDQLSQNLETDQIASIASRIDVLKNDYPHESDLIDLLEYYFHEYHKYKQTPNSLTFQEWLARLIVQQEQEVELKQWTISEPCDLEIQESILNLLLRDRQIIDILLSPSLSLEAVATAHKIYSEVRSAYFTSKSTFENGKKYFEQQAEHAQFIDEYSAAEQERASSKKAYYQAKAKNDRYGDTFISQSTIQDLYEKGCASKRTFEAYQGRLASTYGSLKNAEQLRQACREAGEAMKKSGSYLTQKASILENILNQGLEDQQTLCYRNVVTILDLLAHDHLALATATIEKNQAAIDHLNARISLLKHAESASQNQLNSFHSFMQRGAHEENFMQSFALFQEATSSFLSAYHLLKDQHPSPPFEASQELSDHGIHLVNTALILLTPRITPEHMALYTKDQLITVYTAQFHAERVVEEISNKPGRFYHAKIANFLHEQMLTSNCYYEILSLKHQVMSQWNERIKREWSEQLEHEKLRREKLQHDLNTPIQPVLKAVLTPQPTFEEKCKQLEEQIQLERQQLERQPISPTSFWLLEKAARCFEKSRDLFQQLSNPSSSELSSNDEKAAIKEALELKAQGNNLLQNIKRLLLSNVTVAPVSENEDLNSWSE